LLSRTFHWGRRGPSGVARHSIRRAHAKPSC
jgi:hypothetical protein